MRRLLMIAILLLPRVALGAGIEIDEQSARATGTAGAQTAVARDPSAVFYNPAGLVDQPGFNTLIGGSIIYTHTEATTDPVERAPTTAVATHTSFLPTLFLSQRLGKHVALGAGMFPQWGEHFGWPAGWPGRFVGEFIDVTTATIDFSLSVRLASFLSIGAGVDVVLGQIDLYRAANFAGFEGTLHVGASGTGVGGNVGALIDLVPRYLRLGVMYRSRVDLDLDGDASISAPLELRSVVPGKSHAATTLVLPHTVAVGLALDPIRQLTLSADLRVTLWRDLQTLTLTLTDPHAPPGTAPQSQSLALGLHNSWAIRAGAELRLIGGHLHLRIGGGYDATPLPVTNLGPLLPDTDRMELAAGLGWHERWIAIDVAYMGVILFRRASQNPDLAATYESNGHVISLSATFRLGRAAHQVEPAEPQELREEPAPRGWQP